MTEENRALWLPKRGGKLEVGPAPYTAPGAAEVVVRVRAVAVNPIDAMPGIAYRVVVPWLTFPAIIGWDVAGEVVEVGAGVTRLSAGDRVVGMATALEKDRNRAEEGAFQHFAVLMSHMVAPIPDALSFERAAVLPLAISTAASGMFQADGLALELPQMDSPERGETVVVLGGSTSVGSNAIQLARGAGYRVVATAGARNADYVSSLGAAAAVDRASENVVGELTTAIGDSPLAGVLAIGSWSLGPAIALASTLPGTRRISTAQPTPIARLQAWRQRRRKLHIGLIWGGSLKDNAVGPAIYADYLPAALAAGVYRAAPDAHVVGEGLETIPAALEQLRKGVSAQKLVVGLP